MKLSNVYIVKVFCVGIDRFYAVDGVTRHEEVGTLSTTAVRSTGRRCADRRLLHSTFASPVVPHSESITHVENGIIWDAPYEARRSSRSPTFTGVSRSCVGALLFLRLLLSLFEQKAAVQS